MGITRLSNGLTRLLGRWHEADRTRAELATMDRTLRADLGLWTDGAVAALARGAWREPGRLQRMLARLGLSRHPALADAGYRRDLERTCALCGADRTCARWLRSTDREGYRAFCPNAGEFLTLAGEPAERGNRS